MLLALPPPSFQPWKASDNIALSKIYLLVGRMELFSLLPPNSHSRLISLQHLPVQWQALAYLPIVVLVMPVDVTGTLTYTPIKACLRLRAEV